MSSSSKTYTDLSFSPLLTRGEALDYLKEQAKILCDGDMNTYMELYFANKRAFRKSYSAATVEALGFNALSIMYTSEFDEWALRYYLSGSPEMEYTYDSDGVGTGYYDLIYTVLYEVLVQVPTTPQIAYNAIEASVSGNPTSWNYDTRTLTISGSDYEYESSEIVEGKVEVTFSRNAEELIIANLSTYYSYNTSRSDGSGTYESVIVNGLLYRLDNLDTTVYSGSYEVTGYRVTQQYVEAQDAVYDDDSGELISEEVIGVAYIEDTDDTMVLYVDAVSKVITYNSSYIGVNCLIAFMHMKDVGTRVVIRTYESLDIDVVVPDEINMTPIVPMKVDNEINPEGGNLSTMLEKLGIDYDSISGSLDNDDLDSAYIFYGIPMRDQVAQESEGTNGEDDVTEVSDTAAYNAAVALVASTKATATALYNAEPYDEDAFNTANSAYAAAEAALVLAPDPFIPCLAAYEVLYKIFDMTSGEGTTVKSHVEKLDLYYSYSTVKTTHAGSVGDVGSYTKETIEVFDTITEVVKTPIYDGNSEVIGYTEEVVTTTSTTNSKDVYVYSYQRTETEYDSIAVSNFSQKFTVSGESFEISAGYTEYGEDDSGNETVNYKAADLDEAYMIIPLEVLQSLSFADYVEVHEVSLNFILFATETVTTKWYRTGFAKFIIMVVVITIAVITQQYYLIPLAVAGSAIVTLVTNLIMKTFGLSEKWRSTVSATVAIAMIWAGGWESGWNLALNVVNTGAQVANAYAGYEAQQAIEEALANDVEQEELLELLKSLSDKWTNDGLITQSSLQYDTDFATKADLVFETPSEYLNRTLIYPTYGQMETLYDPNLDRYTQVYVGV